MSNLETNGSLQLELARLYLQGIEKGDMKQVGGTMHKDCIRLTHPRSAGKPVQTKEQYLQHTGEVTGLWTEDRELLVHSVFETPGKVVVHLTVRANTSIGVEMTREMIWIANIVTDEDGNLKVKQVEEFTDSKAYLDFFKVLEEAKINREHSSSHVA